MAPEPHPPGSWDTPQRVLVVLAHPDDPEFFCGGTLAYWARAGHEVIYYLLTCGDKGFNDSTGPDMTPDVLCAIRHEEQLAAASVIGAAAVHWLDRPDGYLVPDLDLRREVVRIIRRIKPSVLVTCDPQNLFAAYGLNHPDHRAAGQVVLDAVFPAAGNKAYFPELIREGLEPHMPREVWVSLSSQPNTVMDVTSTWPDKLEALLQHKTQIGDVEKFTQRILSRHTEDSTDEDPRYEEKFRVIKYV
ncbi:MAG TPA: PIG-L deacetylase family protein [Anaerolineales bacterium]